MKTLLTLQLTIFLLVAVGFLIKKIHIIGPQGQKNINDEEDITTQAKKMTHKTSSNKKNIKTKNPCPVCGEELIFEGGCNVCKSCGWSKCD
jgi:LAS superfamily LD-carboxypeptidase LdcB